MLTFGITLLQTFSQKQEYSPAPDPPRVSPIFPSVLCYPILLGKKGGASARAQGGVTKVSAEEEKFEKKKKKKYIYMFGKDTQESLIQMNNQSSSYILFFKALSHQTEWTKDVLHKNTSMTKSKNMHFQSGQITSLNDMEE